MNIKNKKLARDISTVNGFSVCCFAAVSLAFSVLTLIIGTDGDVYRKYLFPGLFVSMFCYSLVFVTHMIFLGAYVGICSDECCCQCKSDVLVCGISAIICEAASIPLMFQAKAFFYAFLLVLSSLAFFLLISFKRSAGTMMTVVLAVLCGVGAAYQIYLSFSLMLLN